MFVLLRRIYCLRVITRMCVAMEVAIERGFCADASNAESCRFHSLEYVYVCLCCVWL